MVGLVFVFVHLRRSVELFIEQNEHIRNALFVVLVGADFVLHVCCEDVLASGVDGSRVWKPRKLIKMLSMLHLHSSLLDREYFLSGRIADVFFLLSVFFCPVVSASLQRSNRALFCRRVACSVLLSGMLLCCNLVFRNVLVMDCPVPKPLSSSGLNAKCVSSKVCVRLKARVFECQ